MRHTLLLTSLIAAGLTVPALADWDLPGPNDKWIQEPNLNGGYDILSMQGTYPDASHVDKMVADDWLCNDLRPITEIHFWGSWREDDPAIGWTPGFRLAIYTDVPAGTGPTPLPYSTPGVELWSLITPAVERIWDTGIEQFYDPNPGTPLAPNPTVDSVVLQYNVVLDPANYFSQEPGKIYWLSVQALGLEGYQGHYWGWKTSADIWNDDAAWTDLPDTDWQELWDPGHTESLHMAFVLTVPEPRTCTLAAGLALLGFATWRRRRR
ncbi:MAG: PEP-CTERM sorting domain-containing protein [Verrucomicrobiales bacterium]|nr:PEP-CTERM sorting domain-containing protein [Verrucomicrobiales bacterium]